MTSMNKWTLSLTLLGVILLLLFAVPNSTRTAQDGASGQKSSIKTKSQTTSNKVKAPSLPLALDSYQSPLEPVPAPSPDTAAPNPDHRKFAPEAKKQMLLSNYEGYLQYKAEVDGSKDQELLGLSPEERKAAIKKRIANRVAEVIRKRREQEESNRTN
jgi:hypothetical protein